MSDKKSVENDESSLGCLMNAEIDEPGVTNSVPLSLAFMVVAVIVIVLIVSFIIDLGFCANCDGEKRWETYRGVLLEIDMDCSVCCHPSSYFKIRLDNNKTKTVGVSNCDESIESAVSIGSYYVFELEPFPEPYATCREMGEPSCFWTVAIGEIKDRSGNSVYGGDWF